MKYLVLILCLLCLTSCTDSFRSSFTSLGSEHRVCLYSGGKLVREWRSTGKVTSGEHGTRFAFRDKETKSYIRVTGNVTVEQID
jgi:hypothetical protein